MYGGGNAAARGGRSGGVYCRRVHTGGAFTGWGGSCAHARVESTSAAVLVVYYAPSGAAATATAALPAPPVNCSRSVPPPPLSSLLRKGKS